MAAPRNRCYKYMLQFDSVDPYAQLKVLQAAHSIESTRTATAREGNFVVINMKQQLSYMSHVQAVQEALGAMPDTSITVSGSQIIEVQRPTPGPGPAESAIVLAAPIQQQLAFEMDPALTRAYTSNQVLQYVQRGQMQQWEGFIVKLRVEPQDFAEYHTITGNPTPSEYVNTRTGEVMGYCKMTDAMLEADPHWTGTYKNPGVSKLNPMWRTFPRAEHINFCRRMRTDMRHMGTIVDASAIVMAVRPEPMAPDFYLYIQSSRATHAGLQDFLKSLKQVVEVAKWKPRYFNMKVPNLPPKDDINNIVNHGCAIITKRGMLTAWPLATDFEIPAAAFDRGTTSANDELLHHLAEHAIPHLVEAYRSGDPKRVALALADITTGTEGQMRALAALEDVIGDAAAGAEILQAKLHAVDVTTTLCKITDVHQQQEEADANYQLALDHQQVQREKYEAVLESKRRETRNLQSRVNALQSQINRLKEFERCLSSQITAFAVTRNDTWLTEAQRVEEHMQCLVAKAKIDIEHAQKWCGQWGPENRVLSEQYDYFCAVKKQVNRLIGDLQGLVRSAWALESALRSQLHEQVSLQTKVRVTRQSVEEQFAEMCEHARKAGYEITVKKL
ncbi:hypothetical protein JKP88DRAFT_332842 [Tribonema minus]|uniref:Uncharacterized protein n=1 Tax=Tribonema minus TaxID=303371 RepID=A0A836C9X4_9STRA|nr:hypothetical protein JKP88DRAFT_332842 [Tribonema minus]